MHEYSLRHDGYGMRIIPFVGNEKGRTSWRGFVRCREKFMKDIV